MDDSTRPPSADDVVTLLEQDAREEAIETLETVRRAPAEDRKAMVRSLRTLAEEGPAAVGGISSDLTSFLHDDERSVRLTTARLFVALAEATPDAVVPVVPSLADRLADEDEFYYVRARSAEALGYVALEHPTAVDDPAILADLRIGLAFDEPEVREKLAKALEHVALGDPDRLRHQVSSLAEHLDDGNELVRYHLSTALVAIGCASPERLVPVRNALVERLGDENDHVRGRAAEALGLLARTRSDDDAPPEGLLETAGTDGEPFVVERVRFALDSTGGSDTAADASGTVGTRDGVRSTTAEAVETITSPDGGECPHCGLALPEGGPPMCPRCGAPIPRDDGV
jgi:HEAT repeat protein